MSKSSIKCLTICQPWAWAIVDGPKTIENRTWRTDYRGPLLIHAGKSREWLCNELNDGTPVEYNKLVFGAIVGIAELFDVKHRVYFANKEEPFAEGPWCWMLRKAIKFETSYPPFLYRGQQGLYTVRYNDIRCLIPRIQDWLEYANLDIWNWSP